jgi:hypothetical protein
VLARRPTAVSYRLVAGIAIAVVAGIAIGYMDSRPGWDDTGITAISLVLAGGIAASVAGRLPWMMAIATGMWVPLLELNSLASGGPLAALVFAAIGAAFGWLIGHA